MEDEIFISKNQHPLIMGYKEDDPIILEGSRSISRSDFLGGIYGLAEQLPDYPYVINLCKSKELFLFGLSAALIRNQITLLPNSESVFNLEKLSKDYTGSYIFSDQINNEYSGEVFKIEEMPLPLTQIKDIPNISSDNIAVIAFTSGSTGIPKPSEKSWASLVGTSHRLAERFCVYGKNKYTVFSTVSPQHMYGLEASIMMPLQAGYAIHGSRLFYPDDIRIALSRAPQNRILVTTPVHLEVIKKDLLEFPKLETIISATAPLGLKLSKKIEELLRTKVYEIYGFTEAGSVATRRTTKKECWHLLNGYKLTMDELTESHMLSIPEILETFPVPDLIRLESDETFTLKGRSEDIVKVGGKRTSLQELNFHLNEAPGVIDGIIFQPESQDGITHRLVAILKLNPQVSIDDVISHLKLRIDPVFIPRKFVKVSSFSRDANGKIPKEKIINMMNDEKLREI
jgi:acyl-coenzyme A synthetase/AMP-(fatty) acid ligase